MRNARQETILRLVHTHKIGTQRELQEILEQYNFCVTQATLSRDIRNLQLIKKADDNGNYYYQEKEESIALPDLMAFNINGIDSAGNIVVVKCNTGTAQAVCTGIDGFDYPEIVGTLAGDDTIFVLMKNAAQAKKFAEDMIVKLQNR
ncbi:MAG: ArgR family transcriptional regulator [Ruminococcus sp.]|nr:ArgR family transcriptional regulator [Ruminococcus sp.]